MIQLADWLEVGHGGQELGGGKCKRIGRRILEGNKSGKMLDAHSFRSDFRIISWISKNSVFESL